MQSFRFDSVDSTNDVARRLLKEGRITGTASIRARQQTAGRGTRGRSWISPVDAGIYLSIVDRPSTQSTTRLHLFTQAAAIACAETLGTDTGIGIRIKPINDLHVHGRKLGGILTEATIELHELRALVTGVGINVRRADRPVPPDQVQPICLEEIMPRRDFERLDVEELAERLTQSVLLWNAIAARQEESALRTAWDRYCLDPNSFLSDLA